MYNNLYVHFKRIFNNYLSKFIIEIYIIFQYLMDKFV